MKILLPHNYLTLTSVVLLLFGAGLIGAPRLVAELFAIDNSPMSIAFLQFLGASMAAHAYANYRSHGLGGHALRLIVDMNVVALGLAVVIGLVMVLTAGAGGRAVGGLILAMHALFLTGFLVVRGRLGKHPGG